MTPEKDHWIAVFDSGVGGISVLRHLRKFLPQEQFLYYGDTANAPYGSRPTGQVRELTLAAVQKLTEHCPLKALVVACNTATAAAVKELRQQYPELIVIGIEPALKLACDRFPGGRIAVLATPVTLREEKFNHLLRRCGSDCRVFPIAAPGLVELVEAGHTDDAETEALLAPLLTPYRGRLDAVVLGCTHYPFAAGAISRLAGENAVLLDGGEGTARETRRRLEKAGLLGDGPGEVTIESSAGDPRCVALAGRLLQAP